MRTAADRLSPQDVAFLYLESPSTAMHVGSVATFEAVEGFDYETLCDLVAARTTLESSARPSSRMPAGMMPCFLCA